MSIPYMMIVLEYGLSGRGRRERLFGEVDHRDVRWGMGKVRVTAMRVRWGVGVMSQRGQTVSVTKPSLEREGGRERERKRDTELTQFTLAWRLHIQLRCQL
jgi:hypothetical protein